MSYTKKQKLTSSVNRTSPNRAFTDRTVVNRTNINRGNIETINDESGMPIKPYRINIMFQCGCGFSSIELDESVMHCLESKHSITVSGGIQYLKSIPRSKVPEAVESQDKYDKRFDELRKRLAGI